jgi:hypothetical protein
MKRSINNNCQNNVGKIGSINSEKPKENRARRPKIIDS